MKDIEIRVAAAEQKPEVILPMFDKEVEDFSNFMANLSDWRAAGPLNNGEKALLKSYLVHKLKGRF